MILQLWPTNVVVEHGLLHPDDLERFKAAIIPHIDKYNGTPESFNKDIKIPNLFSEQDGVIKLFKSLFKDKLYNLLAAEGFIDPNSLEVDISVFPRRFKKGDRARPHTHRSVDYVGVFYVDLDVVDAGNNTCDHDDGRFILIDPIAQRSRGLNHNMIVQLIPAPNMLVIHPAYMFHESEMYQGDKDRLFVVLNAKVRDRQQSGSFIPL